jgi:serine/alanine racemase
MKTVVLPQHRFYTGNLISANAQYPYREGRAWIELNSQNLRHNVNELYNLLPSDCQLMAAVKADAYGHGAVLVSKELNSLGVHCFCVATVSEGVELRRNGIKGKILILGYTCPQQFFLLRKYRLIQTVIDYAYAKILNTYGKKIKVHLKIDTGMHRLGERSEKMDDICNIFHCKNLIVAGAYTHLCAADNTMTQQKAFTMKQGTIFLEVISRLKERGYSCPKIHLQASYGLLNYPELSGDYARIGIALYGVLSNREDMLNSTIDLRPVLSVKARVASVKDLFKGENAGYGLQYTTNRDRKIAVLAIGYADGLPRSLSCGNGKVLINGCEAPIVGRICMDQTLVDISDIPNVMSGDIAVVIGKSGNSEITAYDLADQTKTITNELLSRLGARLERIMI